MGGARKRKAPLIEDCAVVPLPQDGDCFYKCIARAYASAGLSASDEANEIMLNDKENEVKRLRRCVSRRVDDGVFAQFAVAHQAGLDDYAFMRRLPDAAALRAKLCVSGAESGATRCVWANEFEISTLCDVLELTALIVDESAAENSRFLVVPGREDKRRLQRRCFVVLLRTARSHYNLGAFDDRSLFEGLHQVPKHVREMFGLPNADRRATPRAPRSRRGPPQSPRSPALDAPPRQSPRRPAKEATPRKKAKVEAPPPPAAAPAKKKPPFRAFEERWERRATHKRSAAAEKQLLAKYGGREFRDDDGAYIISTENLEWSAEEGEWTVLAQKKRKKKEEYEGYVVNAQLRRMIARSLPARDVQRK
ncbi:unnamed protein product [Pelagomonas calceolata]|uniref:OTU domain-containing protein n=1 Tax=Pelagomonas calceolata TaxID=35677 RepID=A0A8J2S3V1_9STRA|nr:unnamed protein product [Pelagomonas calceolata]|mmetsp:Transcript_5878/g.17566  ORF Transcript_5878/g.17566 Transcript_5878/m.17566 type:complete len:365 (+) Transcript_5878:321-1415(+)